jgi:Ca2+-dependent lipid-binding protein
MAVPVAAGHWYGTAGAAGHGRRLVVRVKNATGLRDTDGPFAGKSDPYVILRIVDAKGKTVAGPKQTSVKDDTLHPVWNEDIVFDGLETPSAYTLKMNVFDKDTLLGTGHLDWMSSDDALGDGKVDLGTLYRSTGFQDKELVIEWRKLGLFKAKLNIALSTQGQWGN